MGIYYDINTAVTLLVNALPATDNTDGVTPETAIAYNATGMTLYWVFKTPAGALTVTAVTPTSGGAHDWANEGGALYSIALPATGGTINNDTVGYGQFVWWCDGVQVCRSEIYTFRSNVLNNVFLRATALLDVNVVNFAGVAQTAADIGQSILNLLLGIRFGVAQAGTLSSTQATTNLTGIATSKIVGRSIVWTGGTAQDQAKTITAYDSNNGLITFDSMPVAPVAGDTFKIV